MNEGSRFQRGVARAHPSRSRGTDKSDFEGDSWIRDTWSCADIAVKMRAAAVVFVLVIASMVVAACGTAASGPAGYLSRTNDRLLYIRWTNANGILAGSVTTFVSSMYDENGGTAETVDFTGVLGGSAVTLTFPPSTNTAAWTGSIEGDQLRLSLIDDNGKLTTLVLEKALDSDYNAAVGSFAAAAAEAAASASMQALVDAAVVEASKEVTAAMSTLHELIAEPPTLVVGWPDAGSGSAAVDTLATTRKDIADEYALWLSMSPVRCFEFNNGIGISWQIYFVDGWDDKFAVGGASDASIQRWVRSVRTAINQLDIAAANLAQAVSDNPDANPPSSSEASVRAAASSAASGIENRLDRRARVVAQADDIRADVESRYYDKAVSKLRDNGIAASTCTSP